MRTIATPLLFLGLLSLTGCAAHFPEVNTNPAGATAVIDRPPKEVVQTIRNTLNSPPVNIGVSEESPGVIVSGWQRFPGTKRGWRVWQEQTRYYIRVIPD